MSNNDRDSLFNQWIDLTSSNPEDQAVRDLLIDRVTNLPRIPLLIKDIQNTLELCESLGIMYINVVKFSRIEETFGFETFDTIMRQIANYLDEMRGRELRNDIKVTHIIVSGNAFAILLSPPIGKKILRIKELDAIKNKIERGIHRKLKKELKPSIYQKFGCYVGLSILKKNHRARFERLLYGALEDALRYAHFLEERDSIRKLNDFVEIIHRKDLTTVFQPVIDLMSNTIIGYEAFTRGPIGEFELPDNLFRTAYEADLVWQLENICREKTFENAKSIPPKQLLFINMESDAVHDPRLREITEGSHLPVDHDSIVFEITERSAISDYNLFRKTLSHFRALGFKIAIDDIGVGFGSLHSIAEVKPDYIKVDMSLVRGVENDQIRKQLIATLVSFSEKANVKLIAEGIETADELKCLKSLGAKYGQGYYFAYPLPVFQDLN